MISKINERTPGGDSLSRKKIIIPQIYSRSKQKKKPQYKRQQQRSGTSIQYGTDDKKNPHNSSRQIQHLKDILSSCPDCQSRMNQFVTKKPQFSYPNTTEKSTQTIQKSFLIDLIEQRVESICRQNSKMAEVIREKEQELVERQREMAEVEEKFTGIIYALGQELCYLKLKAGDEVEMKENLSCNTETPAYIKALMLDREN